MVVGHLPAADVAQCCMLAAAAWAGSGYRVAMVSVLKHRLALAVLVGVLVIPVLSVNNAGLAHLLFCEATVAQHFAVGSADDSVAPPVTSSTTLSRDDPETTFEGDTQVTEVCQGVRAAITASPLSEERVQLTVTIINDSELTWRGSVGLAAQGESNSADLTATLGEVEPGGSESASMELRVLPGQTEIAGTLLLGP